MYRVGEYVVYNQDGVCEVVDIGKPNIDAIDRSRDYYFLRPVTYAGIIYTPVDTGVYMRPVIGREEALRLIREMPDIQGQITRTRDKKLLAEHYNRLLGPKTCTAFVETIKSIYEKRLTEAGGARKLSATEEQILKRTEQSLYEELAVALDIPQDGVRAYIEGALTGRNGTEKAGGSAHELRESAGLA